MLVFSFLFSMDQEIEEKKFTGDNEEKQEESLIPNDKLKEMMNHRHPLKKIIKSEDISHTIEFLLSNKSSWVSGQLFNIDGGMSSLKI